MAAPAAPAAAPDPLAIRRSHGYVRLLILAALIGVPVAAISYGFQYVVNKLQTWFFSSLPESLGRSLPEPEAGVGEQQSEQPSSSGQF